MVSFRDTLWVIIFSLVVWFFFTGIMILCIYSAASKKFDKNKEKYAFFTYPFYKKIFLLGLKGVLNPIVVIATFLTNIAVLSLLVTGLWNLISPNIIISYIFYRGGTTT